MADDAIASIVAFLLNSAVLSSFIIPQAQKLKEIKDRLFQFGLRADTTLNYLGTPTPESQGLDETDIQKLQAILDTYDTRANELRPFYWLFLASTVLAGIAIVWISVCPGLRSVILPIHILCQLVVLLVAVRTYVVHPDRLASASYLVESCAINPHLLVTAMRLELWLGSGKPLGERQAREDPVVIRLGLRLRVHGFRFLLIVSDATDNVYFVSFGPVRQGNAIWRMLENPSLQQPEVCWVEVGKARLNQIPGTEAQTRLLVFMPMLSHERTSPMLARGHIEAGAGAVQLLGGQSGGLGRIATGSTYEPITYRGVGAKIIDLHVADDHAGADVVVQKVLRRFGKDLTRARGVVQHENLDGIDLEVK